MTQAQSLPARPNLNYLKTLAKERLKSLRAAQPNVKLADVQLAIARERGFASWRKLRAYVEAVRNALSAQAGPPAPEISGELMQAISKRDLDSVRTIIAAHPGAINQSAPHPRWGGRPAPLQVGVETGDLAMVKALLDAGADPNDSGALYDGWSPLMLAVHWKHSEIVEELLQRGTRVGLIETLMLGDDRRLREILKSDPAAMSGHWPNDASPLHFARTLRAGKLLLKHGASVDAVDKYGKTPVQAVAAVGGDPKLVKILLRRGESAPPWVYAAMGDQSRLTSLARKDASLIRDPKVLNAAVENGRANVVRWLLAQGADPNSRTPNGNASVLHTAAWVGNLPIVKLLVARGAERNARDKEHDNTPAGFARHAYKSHSRESCLKVAEFLESGESDGKKPPEKVKNKQWKPIMDAAFLGDAAALRRLIKAGADPNVVSTTAHRYRPLHRTIEPKKLRPRTEKHEEAVKVLLAAGADPTLRGGFARLTALQMAASGGWRFVKLLRQYFEPLDIFHAAALADEPRARELLTKDRRLADARDLNGWTALHHCCASTAFMHGVEAAQVAIAKLLIENGADCMATYQYAQWPISALYHCCGGHDNPAVAEVLLQAGADPCDNETVYHAADEQHEHCLALIEKYVDKKKLARECTKCLGTQMHWGFSRGAAWLLAHGANPNDLGKWGNSPLHSAVKNSANDKVIRLLLEHGADSKLKNKDGKTAIALAKSLKRVRILKQLQEHATKRKR